MTEVWMHKLTGELALVTEVFANVHNMYAVDIEMMQAIGYMFENKYGVHIVLPYSATEYFENLGPIE